MPQDSQRWPRNGTQQSYVWEPSSGHRGSSWPLLGPSWATFAAKLPSNFAFGHLHGRNASSKSASCKPRYALDLPQAQLFVWLSKICDLPSPQHVTLKLTLPSPNKQPENTLRHTQIGPRSPKIPQDGLGMAPQTSGNR